MDESELSSSDVRLLADSFRGVQQVLQSIHGVSIRFGIVCVIVLVLLIAGATWFVTSTNSQNTLMLMQQQERMMNQLSKLSDGLNRIGG